MSRRIPWLAWQLPSTLCLLATSFDGNSSQTPISSLHSDVSHLLLLILVYTPCSRRRTAPAARCRRRSFPGSPASRRRSLSDSSVMPSSHCSARVKAWIVSHPVIPSSRDGREAVRVADFFWLVCLVHPHLGFQHPVVGHRWLEDCARDWSRWVSGL